MVVARGLYLARHLFTLLYLRDDGSGGHNFSVEAQLNFADGMYDNEKGNRIDNGIGKLAIMPDKTWQ